MSRRVIVEACDAKNRNPIFDPYSTIVTLRGRWDSRAVAGQSMHESLAQLGQVDYIPGLRIMVDYDQRTIKLYDPIGDAEYKSVLDLLNRTARNFPMLFGGSEVRPRETIEYSNVDNDKLKDWLYHARRHVDNGSMKIIEGELPDEEFIRAMPGKRFQFYGTSFNVKPDDRYTDIVPEGAELAGVGAGGGRSARGPGGHRGGAGGAGGNQGAAGNGGNTGGTGDGKPQE